MTLYCTKILRDIKDRSLLLAAKCNFYGKIHYSTEIFENIVHKGFQCTAKGGILIPKGL